MENKLLLQCLGIAFLGIAFHIILKLDSLKKLRKASNLPFSPLDYFKEDWLAILSSVVAVFVFVMTYDEVVNYAPGVINYTKWLFFCVGSFGSYVLNLALGKSKEAIIKIIDVKTNIADNVTTAINQSNTDEEDK